MTNECRAELKQLLRIRSQSIGLMPEIQDNCIIDLATCKNPDMKGEVSEKIDHCDDVWLFDLGNSMFTKEI